MRPLQLNPDHLILGPAQGDRTDGRIEERIDGGMSWQLASNGLTVPWAKNMVERFLKVEDDLLAILSDGSLLSTHLPEFSWQVILPEATQINAAAAS